MTDDNKHCIDEWNPTPHEIRNWAMDKDPTCCQDWELALTRIGIHRLIFDLATDPTCPNWKWFLGVVYLETADAFRGNGVADLVANADDLIAYSVINSSVAIENWRKRVSELKLNSLHYDYDAWCWHGYSNLETEETMFGNNARS